MELARKTEALKGSPQKQGFASRYSKTANASEKLRALLEEERVQHSEAARHRKIYHDIHVASQKDQTGRLFIQEDQDGQECKRTVDFKTLAKMVRGGVRHVNQEENFVDGMRGNMVEGELRHILTQAMENLSSDPNLLKSLNELANTLSQAIERYPIQANAIHPIVDSLKEGTLKIQQLRMDITVKHKLLNEIQSKKSARARQMIRRNPDIAKHLAMQELESLDEIFRAYNSLRSACHMPPDQRADPYQFLDAATYNMMVTVSGLHHEFENVRRDTSLFYRDSVAGESNGLTAFRGKIADRIEKYNRAQEKKQNEDLRRAQALRAQADSLTNQVGPSQPVRQTQRGPQSQRKTFVRRISENVWAKFDKEIDLDFGFHDSEGRQPLPRQTVNNAESKMDARKSKFQKIISMGARSSAGLKDLLHIGNSEKKKGPPKQTVQAPPPRISYGGITQPPPQPLRSTMVDPPPPVEWKMSARPQQEDLRGASPPTLPSAPSPGPSRTETQSPTQSPTHRYALTDTPKRQLQASPGPPAILEAMRSSPQVKVNGTSISFADGKMILKKGSFTETVEEPYSDEVRQNIAPNVPDDGDLDVALEPKSVQAANRLFFWAPRSKAKPRMMNVRCCSKKAEAFQDILPIDESSPFCTELSPLCMANVGEISSRYIVDHDNTPTTASPKRQLTTMTPLTEIEDDNDQAYSQPTSPKTAKGAQSLAETIHKRVAETIYQGVSA